MNILITAAVTAQAYQLKRILEYSDTVFLGDSVDLPNLGGDTRFVKIPVSDSSSFAHLLLTLCLDLQIEKVYPLRKNELIALAEARQLFDEYGIIVMVPDKNFLNPLLHKGIKGTILIQEGIATNGMPDRGVLLVDEETKQFQLFTAD